MAQSLPIARTDGLIIREIHEETLVYDQSSHEAHSLNRTALAVWKHCDGKTSIQALARILQRDLGLVSASNEDLVRLALKELDACNLLQGGAPVVYNVSRREMLKLGFAAAVLPLVSSIVAPSADQAQSPPVDGLTGPTGPIGDAGTEGGPP